ncbi:MAG: enoyl-CoA hydratase-related protein [Acidimicrobiia bacterium]|jgi:enoyl-CoA hydratase/carnithine racemase
MTDDAPHALLEIDDRVAVITLHRPDVLNAFSTRMGLELEAAYRECDARDDVRAVVLTGSGRAFCAGADLSRGGDTFGAQEPRAFRSDPFDVHAWDVRKPVIAAINGHAVGLGLTLALQTDIRLVAEDAKCGIVQTRRGVLPDLRSHWTLTRAVGHARAAEILLTGRLFSGSELAAMGVASRALPAVDVLPAALDIARDIAVNTAPVSVAASKRILWMDPPPSGAEIDRLEREVHLHLMGRADAREGALAFLERRDPEWSLTVSDDWPDAIFD